MRYVARKAVAVVIIARMLLNVAKVGRSARRTVERQGALATGRNLLSNMY